MIMVSKLHSQSHSQSEVAAAFSVDAEGIVMLFNLLYTSINLVFPHNPTERYDPASAKNFVFLLNAKR